MKSIFLAALSLCIVAAVVNAQEYDSGNTEVSTQKAVAEVGGILTGFDPIGIISSFCVGIFGGVAYIFALFVILFVCILVVKVEKPLDYNK